MFTMSMLQQSVETAFWQSPIDVIIPDSDEVIEFMSHTIVVQVTDGSKTPLCNQELLLSSSSPIEMLINGSSKRGSSAGIAVKTDEQGSLTIIIPADGVAAPVLTVKDVPSGNILGGRTVNVDPMQKLWDQMEQIQSAEDLRNLKLKDGKPFVKPALSERELQKTLEAIQEMCQARRELASGKKQAVTKPTTADRRWGAWKYIKSQIDEAIDSAIDSAVEKAGTAWKFVVKIAGEVWEFVVENFPQVAAALEEIMNLVSDGWEWAKEKLVELLPWNDILSVKNVLVNVTTAGIILGSDLFASLEQQADDTFNDMRKKIRELKDKKLPKELTDVKISRNPPLPEGAEESGLSDIMSSPQAQFGTFHLRHSGGDKKTNSGILGHGAEGDTSFGRLQKRLEGIFDSIIQLAHKFGTNIKDIFSNKKFALDILLAKVGLDLAEDALGVMQKAVTAILGSLSDHLVELADAMNADMKIPVISSIYRKMTRNSRCSPLDMVCLIIAIPSTIVYKIAIGPLPVEDKTFAEVTKPDAFHGVLDQMLGRPRSSLTSNGNISSRPQSNHVESTQAAPFYSIHRNVPIVNAANSAGSQPYAGQFESRQAAPHYEIRRNVLPANSTDSQSNGHKSPDFAERSDLNARPKRDSDDLPLEQPPKRMKTKESQPNAARPWGGSVAGIQIDSVKDWLAKNYKVCINVIQIAMPIAAGANTICRKLPKATAAGSGGSSDASTQSSGGDTATKSKKSSSGFVTKIVFWIAKGIAVIVPKISEGLKDKTKSILTHIKNAMGEPVFYYKLMIWLIPGALPVVGSLFGDFVAACTEVVSSVTQTLWLIVMHVDVYAISKAAYPWYKCPEDYINAIAKGAVGVAVLLQGKEPWSLGFAYGLTTFGKIWTVIRVSKELEFMDKYGGDVGCTVDDIP